MLVFFFALISPTRSPGNERLDESYRKASGARETRTQRLHQGQSGGRRRKNIFLSSFHCSQNGGYLVPIRLHPSAVNALSSLQVAFGGDGFSMFAMNDRTRLCRLRDRSCYVVVLSRLPHKNLRDQQGLPEMRYTVNSRIDSRGEGSLRFVADTLPVDFHRGLASIADTLMQLLRSAKKQRTNRGKNKG